jgi:hypothetical protein
MHIRLFKRGNPLRRKKAASTQRFAWLPRKLDNGTYVWLERYTRRNKYAGYGA